MPHGDHGRPALLLQSRTNASHLRGSGNLKVITPHDCCARRLTFGDRVNGRRCTLPFEVICFRPSLCRAHRDGWQFVLLNEVSMRLYLAKLLGIMCRNKRGPCRGIRGHKSQLIWFSKFRPFAREATGSIKTECRCE